MAVKIRNHIAVDEGEPSFPFEEGNHAWPLLEEHRNPCFVVTVAKFMPEVAARRLDILDDAGRYRRRVARDPEPATRPRGGAADLRLFLDHDDVESQRCGRHGG
jgi:hypothetical protein